MSSINFEKLSLDTQLAIKHAIAVAWSDESFADMLGNHPHEALKELGYELPSNVKFEFE